MRLRLSLLWLAHALLYCYPLTVTVRADEPSTALDSPLLHQQIDQLVGQAAGRDSWPLASDAVFLRRIHLDLVGMLPDVDEVRRFLADPSPQKRSKVIDQLLADPRHARHMANWLDLTLMERRAKVHVEPKEWETYLRESFVANKPLHTLAQEILSADGTIEEQRAATRFYLARNVEPNLMTRDIGRVFFGRDLQCAQCHNHPHIDDYYQSDYYGIFAFVGRSFLFKDKANKVFVADKADGEVEFTSVFTGDKGKTGPQLPSGARLVEPVLAPDALYTTAPADGVRPVPAFSRRAWLAEQVARGDNTAFNRNWANRLWAVMFGKGLVHPLDLHHSDNPPTHPQLLQLLGTSLAQLNFDTRAFLRELALSRTYQRAFDVGQADALTLQPPGETIEVRSQRLQQLRDSLAVEMESHREAHDSAPNTWSQARRELDQSLDAWLAAQTSVVSLEANQRKLMAAAKQQGEQASILQRRLEHIKAAQDQTRLAQETLGLADNQIPTAVFAQQATALQGEFDKAKAAQSQSEQALAPIPEQIETAQQQRTELERAKVAAEPLHATAEQQWHEQRDRMSRLQMQLTECEQALEFLATEATRDATLQQWRQASTSLSQLNQQIAELTQQLAASTGKLAERETRLKSHQEEVLQLTQVTTGQAKELERLTQLEQRFVALSNSLTEAGRWLDAPPLSSIAETAQGRLQQCTADQKTLRTAYETARTRLDDMTAGKTELEVEIGELAQELARLTETRDGLTERLSSSEQEATRLQAQLNEAQSRWLELAEERCVVGNLTPLSPEQLAWSLMQVTGVVDNQIAAQIAELEKATPLTDEQKGQPDVVESRRKQAEIAAYEKLQGSVNVFVSLFGHGAGQPQDGFFATVDQSLFFANAGTVQGWIGQGGQSLYQRLLPLTDARSYAEELYLSVFCRAPRDDEMSVVAAHLESLGDDRATATRELIWALVTSSEFRFNH